MTSFFVSHFRQGPYMHWYYHLHDGHLRSHAALLGVQKCEHSCPLSRRTWGLMNPLRHLHAVYSTPPMARVADEDFNSAHTKAETNRPLRRIQRFACVLLFDYISTWILCGIVLCLDVSCLNCSIFRQVYSEVRVRIRNRLEPNPCPNTELHADLAEYRDVGTETSEHWGVTDLVRRPGGPLHRILKFLFLPPDICWDLM